MENNIPIRTPALLDGAVGSNLVSRGLEAGECVEDWILKNPEALKDLQREFIEAGAEIIYAPTFSANRIRLGKFGLDGETEEINRRLVLLTKEAVGDKALTAGILSSTGEYCEPIGEIPFSEMMDIYDQQAHALEEAGADLFVVETMTSLSEIRAAVLACRKYKLPIFVTITVNEYGRTASDATALSCLITLQGMGISAFGLNCSEGPFAMAEIISELRKYARVPLIAKPAAVITDENGRRNLTPEEMGEGMKLLLESGAVIAGGCCGTTPEHLRATKGAMDETDFSAIPAVEKEDTGLILANEAQAFFLAADGLECSEPLECTVDMADELLELSDTNTDVITIRLNSTDDAYQFSLNAHMARLPVMFQSDDYKAVKAALMFYHGRAMIDSSCEIPEEELSRLSDKYGAVVY